MYPSSVAPFQRIEIAVRGESVPILSLRLGSWVRGNRKRARTGKMQRGGLHGLDMPSLPNFEFNKRVNHSPHVVILGAGASRAAFPDGDAKKRRLPLMADLIECLGLRDSIRAAGFV